MVEKQLYCVIQTFIITVWLVTSNTRHVSHKCPSIITRINKLHIDFMLILLSNKILFITISNKEYVAIIHCGCMLSLSCLCSTSQLQVGRGTHWPPGHVEPLALFAIPLGNFQQFAYHINPLYRQFTAATSCLSWNAEEELQQHSRIYALEMQLLNFCSRFVTKHCWP